MGWHFVWFQVHKDRQRLLRIIVCIVKGLATHLWQPKRLLLDCCFVQASGVLQQLAS